MDGWLWRFRFAACLAGYGFVAKWWRVHACDRLLYKNAMLQLDAFSARAKSQEWLRRAYCQTDVDDASADASRSDLHLFFGDRRNEACTEYPGTESTK